MHGGDWMQAVVEWDYQGDWWGCVDRRNVRDGDGDGAGCNRWAYGGRGCYGWDAAESAGGVECGGDGEGYCVGAGVCDHGGDGGGEEL